MKILILLIFILIVLLRPFSFFDENVCGGITVDKIFLLTMEKSKERREYFINSLKETKSDLPLELIYSTDTTKPENVEKFKMLVDPEKFDKMFKLDRGEIPRKHLSDFNSGALGCYLGHMEFYKRSFEQNLRYSMIFEDNVILSDSFVDELKISLETIPNDFDIIFFHSWKTADIGYNNDCGKIKKVKKVMGTKCYLINVENMKKYFPLFYPIDNHIDLKYSDLVKQGCIIYYKPLKSIKINYFKGSTISHNMVKSGNLLLDLFNLSETKQFYFESFV